MANIPAIELEANIPNPPNGKSKNKKSILEKFWIMPLNKTILVNLNAIKKLSKILQICIETTKIRKKGK